MGGSGVKVIMMLSVSTNLFVNGPLDQKKLHGSYQIVYQQYRVCWDCHFLPKELE